MTNGLQFQASYTRSIARDNGQTSVTFTATNTPTDPYNVNLDRGRTSSDIPHRFVASAIWSPKKWTILFSKAGPSRPSSLCSREGRIHREFLSQTDRSSMRLTAPLLGRVATATLSPCGATATASRRSLMLMRVFRAASTLKNR